MSRVAIPFLRPGLRGYGSVTSEGMPVLTPVNVTALAVSFEDLDVSRRVSEYCREAPCTLVQKDELDALRADVKARLAETEKAKADGQTMVMVAAGVGFALGYFILKR